MKKGMQAALWLLKIYCILYFIIVFLHIYKCVWKPGFLKSSHKWLAMWVAAVKLKKFVNLHNEILVEDAWYV